MTSDRIYRQALSKKFTLTYISEMSGIAFDPDIVIAFLEMMSEVQNA
jgi:HD-GYP domain-containing protein (c-di-GMP phosphodiesterase class II)